MTDLHDLLARATDAVEAPGGAAAALREARRRTRRRRGAVAGLAAATAVAAVVVAVRVGTGGAGDTSPPPAVSPTPTVSVVQPTLDPRTVDDLPDAPDDLAPLLPDVLDLPTGSTPALSDDPVEAAVLTVRRSDALKVLGVDGGWRHVPLPWQNGSDELSPDGTRLAVATETGVDVWTLGTGARVSLPFPAGYQSSGDVAWTWLDGRSLLLDDRWKVDSRTGAAGRVPASPGPDGDAVASVGWSDSVGSLAVTVADEVLPVRDDEEATYGNGGLSVQAVLPDGTVLLRVLVDPGPRPSVRYVAWQPDTGDLSLVMRTPEGLPASSLAVDLLG